MPTTEEVQMQETKLALEGSPVLVKIYVVYYSMYGNVERLAEKLQEGANLVEGVPQTLSTEELAKLGAPAKSDVLIIQPNELLRLMVLSYASHKIWNDGSAV
ncbi:hypothetical protein VNO78_06337 [Psophocarpus tetragonolobus]|uniref:Flavodoxin-like domain-containing protein n=1 Tax=Psophocarpus tetragonolobus TaxID=3891 RepID=A0AAN9SS04_PSOTE